MHFSLLSYFASCTYLKNVNNITNNHFHYFFIKSDATSETQRQKVKACIFFESQVPFSKNNNNATINYFHNFCNLVGCDI